MGEPSQVKGESPRRRWLVVCGWLAAAAAMLVVNRLLADSDLEPGSWVSTMRVFTGGPGPAVATGFALAELYEGYRQRRARRSAIQSDTSWPCS